jgi:hypothetical protein
LSSRRPSRISAPIFLGRAIQSLLDLTEHWGGDASGGEVYGIAVVIAREDQGFEKVYRFIGLLSPAVNRLDPCSYGLGPGVPGWVYRPLYPR